MSVKSLRRSADNRATYHRGLIAAERSQRAKLRRAVEWVIAESRVMDLAGLVTLTDRMCAFASDLNERSRP